MKICILMASAHKQGNTAALLSALKLRLKDAELKEFFLFDMDLRPCVGCNTCQNQAEGFGCVIDDDMSRVFDAALQSDVILFATPIYSWYCTTPLKSAMDRLVRTMNKYYGKGVPRASLWRGKRLAALVSSGYPVEKAADAFDLGLKHYAKHSKLDYIGLLGAQLDQIDEAAMDEFAQKIWDKNKFNALV